VVVDVLSILQNNLEPFRISYQTIDASLFSVEPMWMQEVKSYLKIG